MGFPKQEHWSGLPFPPPGDLPDPEIEPTSPALQADSLPLSRQGSLNGLKTNKQTKKKPLRDHRGSNCRKQLPIPRMKDTKRRRDSIINTYKIRGYSAIKRNEAWIHATISRN